MLKYVIGFISCMAAFGCFAQSKDPVNWTFSFEKVNDTVSLIKIMAIIEAPWHIYSMDAAGAGGYPTMISFKKNPLVKFAGQVTSGDKVYVKKDETLGITVRYYQARVQFQQKIVVKSNAVTSIAGTVSYMACTDVTCLPPASKAFSIKLN